MQKSLKVQEAYSGDALNGIARIHPDDMSELELNEGDLIEITGKKITAARGQGTVPSVSYCLQESSRLNRYECDSTAEMRSAGT